MLISIIPMYIWMRKSSWFCSLKWMSRLFRIASKKEKIMKILRQKQNEIRLVHEKFGNVFVLGMQSKVSCQKSIMWLLQKIWISLDFLGNWVVDLKILNGYPFSLIHGFITVFPWIDVYWNFQYYRIQIWPRN